MKDDFSVDITPYDYTAEDIREARRRLWRMGIIYWKLDKTQMDIYNFYKSASKTNKIIVINAARRIGKTYGLVVLAVEECIKNKNVIVRILQPEQKMVRQNIQPIMDKILSDCPDDLRPKFKTQENSYKFPNGSELRLAGTDNGNYEKFRGGDSNLDIVDEAAFVKANLKYMVRSIFIYSTMLTKGKIILSSTSPVDPYHDFAKYMASAELKGAFIRKTIYDSLEDNKNEPNPRITQDLIQEIIEEYPEGVNSDDYRRECLCEIVQDSDDKIIPEFDSELERDIVLEWPRPAYCHKFVSMDIGFKDLTVILFAYYDFKSALTVVEDELVVNGPKMTTNYLNDIIKKKEKELWTDKLTNTVEKPRKRVADASPILLNDLQVLHHLTFFPTHKDIKDAMVNQLRIELNDKKIIINPKCKTLISHLKNGAWDKNRRKFIRVVGFGHFDAIDALIYLSRNIDKYSNPFPKGYAYSQLGENSTIFIKNGNNSEENSPLALVSNAFKPKSSLKINK